MEKYLTSVKELVIQAFTNGSEIKAKAENGDALSCFQMGMIHLLGIDTPIDFKKAGKYLGTQSLCDDPDANRLLGFIAECEGNYSQAFKNYANAGKAKRPYINKVSEERIHLQGDFKKLDLPSTVMNKIITNVLNEYIKGGDNKVEASVRIAMICEDEESCLDAAQTLYDAEDYYSAMSWLQKANIPDSNSLYASVKDKLSDSKGTLDLPTTLDVIEIDGNSFLANFDAPPSYAGIKNLCDEAAVACTKEWQDSVSPKIATIKKKVENEEAARLKKQKEEENARLKKEKEEEARLFKLQMAEEYKEEKKKRKRRIIDIVLLCILSPLELAIIVAMLFSEKGVGLSNIIGLIVMSAIFVVLPFLGLRWVIRKIMKLN